MKTQIINGRNGLPAGVFIPIEDWENIKKQYPEMEKKDFCLTLDQNERKPNLVARKMPPLRDFLDILD